MRKRYSIDARLPQHEVALSCHDVVRFVPRAPSTHAHGGANTLHMTTLEIGKKLVEMCNQGKAAAVIDTLYAPDIVSVEAGGPPGMSREVKGLEAIHAKSKWWSDNHTIHSAKAEGPWPNGDQFIVHFQYDVTNKPNGQRFVMDEMALYTVKNDKIVHEAFFYTAG
jgi:hypothetical protein